MKLKVGNIVEFWLVPGTGDFDPKVARWQPAEVMEIMDDVVMILPWHCGCKTLRCKDDLYRVAKSNADYRKIVAERKTHQRRCHHIGYGDVTERPDYCERLTMTEDELESCTCCPQCCGCGG